MSPIPNSNDFVSIIGLVHLSTDLGTFLDVQGRRVFVPTGYMDASSRRFATGEMVTIAVDQAFAERERLIPVREPL